MERCANIDLIKGKYIVGAISQVGESGIRVDVVPVFSYDNIDSVVANLEMILSYSKKGLSIEKLFQSWTYFPHAV